MFCIYSLQIRHSIAVSFAGRVLSYCRQLQPRRRPTKRFPTERLPFLSFLILITSGFFNPFSTASDMFKCNSFPEHSCCVPLILSTSNHTQLTESETLREEVKPNEENMKFQYNNITTGFIFDWGTVIDFINEKQKTPPDSMRTK